MLSMLSGLRSGLISGVNRPVRKKGAITPSGSGTSVQFTFSSFGDTNGVFYYLGTNQLTETWSNPHPTEVLTTLTGGDDGAPLTDRQQTGNSFDTTPGIGAEMRVDFGIGKRFEPTYYTLQHTDAYIANNYAFEASVDGATWDTLNSVTDGNFGAYQWTGYTVAPLNRYRYVRIRLTGNDSFGNQYLCLSELELYGTLYI